MLWLPLWGMAAKTQQAKQVRRAREVVTLEDHLADGGFGSWLFEAVSHEPGLAGRLRSLALDPRICGMVAGQETLNAEGGLTRDLMHV